MEVNQEFIDRMNKYLEPDKEKGLIENCSSNVNIFAQRMLGIKPRAWQIYFMNKLQKAIEDGGIQSKEFVALTSRQVGKSTVLAIFSLWCCVFNKYPGTTGNNTLVGIASASDVQAKKLLYEMKKFIRLGDAHIKNTYLDEDDKPVFGESFFSDLLDDHEPNNTTTITFKAYNETVHGDLILKDSKAGSVIKSYPPTAAVLGETFSIVIIDEAGKTDKITDQFFYDFMYPTGNSTNAIRIYTSTPWVPSGFFYRMVDPDNMYSDYNVDVVEFTIDSIYIEDKNYYDVVMNTINQLNNDGKTSEVQRAYYCRFIKGEKVYFDPEKVQSVFTEPYQKYSYFTDECDMGVDFGGQTISKTVITITRMDDEGNIYRLYDKVYGVGEDDGLLDDMTELMTKFNVQRVIPDDCPAGDFLIRRMKDKGWDVHPMNFKSDKVKKYGAFRASMNRGQVHSYNDDNLKTEMLALEQSDGARSTIIRHAPNYTDDRIDSFVMSAYFYVQEDEGVKVYDYDYD